jgi:hypothetical protein
MSASEPTAIVPFFGNRPNIFALPSAVSSTKRFREILFSTTPPLIDQRHAVFYAGSTVRDLGEIIFAKFFLLLHAERTMIGSRSLEVVHLQTLPKLGMIMLFAQAAVS